MSGYWNKPEETAEAFRGGWFHSGDLVREDEDGYLYVVDRKKDMIISGGENIYCAEVENVLAAHPKIAEVALIGVPDARYGEAPLAVVAPRDPADPPTAADVEAFCRERLAAYKRPRDVVIVDALPRNPSGKVLKTRLRAEYGATAVVAAACPPARRGGARPRATSPRAWLRAAHRPTSTGVAGLPRRAATAGPARVPSADGRARLGARRASPPRCPRSPSHSTRCWPSSTGSSSRPRRTGSTPACSATSRPTPRCTRSWATCSPAGSARRGCSGRPRPRPPRSSRRCSTRSRARWASTPRSRSAAGAAA